MQMAFADSKVPVFKEKKDKGIYLYGEENDYPDHLLHLYNKSAKHGSIVNGKVSYIAGNGLKAKTESPKADQWLKNFNSNGESADAILKRSVKDIEIFGGFAWMIIPKMGGSFEIHHQPFKCFRKTVDGKYQFKKDWKNNKEAAITYPAFKTGLKEPSIFYYKEYRPDTDIYPLPGYLGTNNYIETDIEISKYYLSAITNGMMPSKMIQFFNGTPTDEAKKEIEKRLKRKYTGSENAGQFFLVFNSNKDQEVKIDDLSGTELDKLFAELNKTVQQEIFSGHQVTSPMLFGVKEQGQLGGRDEIMNSYEIFKNTYCNEKQRTLENIFNYFAGLLNIGTEFYIQDVDPLGIEITADLVKENLTRNEIRDMLGYAGEEEVIVGNDAVVKALNSLSPLVANKVLESMTPDEIRAIVSLPPKIGGDQLVNVDTPVATNNLEVNSAIKGLKGREFQNLERIVRKYKQGKINRQQAEAMLKSGYALSDDEVAIWLDADQFSKTYSEVEAAEMFAACGDDATNYELVHEIGCDFSSDEDMANFEEQFFKDYFAEQVTQIEANVIDILKKNKRATPKDIALAVKSTEASVSRVLAGLQQRGLVVRTVTDLGDVERTVTTKISDLSNKPTTVNVQLRYVYAKRPEAKGAAIIDTTRPFCERLVKLSDTKVFSRSDIENISIRLGYSVFDRGGGFWGNKPHCRHYWKALVTLKK